MGSAEGRVFIADQPDRGIPGVTVMAGEYAVGTDIDGHFELPALDPGDYLLTVDPASLGIGMRPMVELPITFTVSAGCTTRLEIPVVQSASIEGRVFMNIPAAPGEAVSTWPVADVRVELRGEDGSQYKYTDTIGHFIFFDLKPGEYTLTLLPDDIPAGYAVLEPTSYEIELAAGEPLRNMDFTIGPMEREIVITTDKSFVWD
jgi:uncharacterized surface anchored protein